MRTQNSSIAPIRHRIDTADISPRPPVFGWLSSLAFSTLFFLSAAATQAAVAPPLASTQNLAILAAAGVSNTGPSLVIGDLGIWPNGAGSVTGFMFSLPPGPGQVLGTTHLGDGVAATAQGDLTVAYNNLAGQACDTLITADLGGMTLQPGVYCSGSSLGLTGTVTLDGLGDPNAVWVFQMPSTLTTASNSAVKVINGGQSGNVFWQVGSSATLGTNTAFAGNILAQASISLNTGASLNGKALARTGAITLDSNAITNSVAVPVGPTTPPTLSKAFSPASINASGVAVLTVTLSNANAAVATLTAPLTDNLPSGLVVAATPNETTTCTGAGALVAVAGSSSVTLPAGRSIPSNGSCVLTVNVTAAAVGAYLNTLSSNALVTSNGNNVAPAVATLTIVSPVSPPTLAKAFTPVSINAGGVSTLSVTLSNPNAAIATLTTSLIDNLPSGLVIAATPAVSTTCGGVGLPVAVAGSTSVTLPAGRTIPGNGSCVLSVSVTAAIGGAYINTLPAVALVTSNGNNVAPATATLTVVSPVAPPTLGKAFSPASINLGGVSTLTITLSNANAAVATLTAPLTDSLPSGVVIAPVPNLATTCTGVGAAIAVAGGTTVSLPAGRSIPANGSCTLTVAVTAASGGAYLNTLPIAALKTNNGSNAAPALATLTVVSPVLLPVLGKAFSPPSIGTGGISTLTVTLSNANAAAATLTAPLIDNLPSGVRIAPTPAVATTCGGVGAPVAVAGGSSVTLPAGRSIPGNGNCVLTVAVTAAAGGSYLNTLLAGALVTNQGNNATLAAATLTAVPPTPPAPDPLVRPTLGKAFSPASINVDELSTLTIVLSNPNAGSATLNAPLVDQLPNGVVIAPVPNVTTTCNGAGAPIALAGGSSVTLPAGRSIPANGSCEVTAQVTAAVGGSYLNTLPIAALKTNNGSNAALAVATLTVVTPVIPPALGKSFSPASINAGGVSTLTVILSNLNATVATLTAPLTDTLPSGVLIAPIPNLTTTCGGVGAPAAVAGGTTVTLPVGRLIPANDSCVLTVDVTAAMGGAYLNTLPAGALATSHGNNAAPVLATLTVVTPVVPPALAKAFAPASINPGEAARLTISLSNANATPATLTLPLIDNLPSGLVVATIPNVTTSCAGVGDPVAIAGSQTVTLPAGRIIPGNGECLLGVDVTAAVGGAYLNTLLVGALVTSNGSNIAPTAATLIVVTPVIPPALGKAFSPITINAGGLSLLTVTLSNLNPAPATLTAPLIDTLPSGVVIAPVPNAATTCLGAAPLVAVPGSLSVTLPAGYAIPPNDSCVLTVSVTAAVDGSYLNTLLAGALKTSNGNNPAPAVATLVATLAVVPPIPALPPTLGKRFTPASVEVGSVSVLTLVLSNPNATIADLTAPLVDTLPNGLVIAPLPNAATTCTGVGAPVAVAGGATVTLPVGRSIPANGSCVLTVNVTALAASSYQNSLLAGALVTSQGNNTGPATATLVAATPAAIAPVLSKTFNPLSIDAGSLSTLSLMLDNPSAVIATLTAPLVDTLPNGLVVAPIPNLSTTCSGIGDPVAVAGGSTVTLPAGRAIPANGSCVLTVSVTALAAGSYQNSLLAGALVTDQGNNAGPATATLTVLPVVLPPPIPPVLSKTFNPASINAGGITTLLITLDNPSGLVATLTAPLVDNLPTGLVVAPIPNVLISCVGIGWSAQAPGDGIVSLVQGGSSITLPAGIPLPANTVCTLAIDVTAALGNSYLNSLPAGALLTSNGGNLTPGTANLTVITPPPIVIPPVIIPPVIIPPVVVPHNIPTLSEWAMLILAALMALMGFAVMQRGQAS